MPRQRTEPRRLTRAQWVRYENVGLEPDLDVDERLKLHWVDRSVDDLRVKGALVGLTLRRSIEEASTVTMTLRDPHGRVLGEHAEQAGRYADPDAGRRRMRQAYKRDPVLVDEGWEPILAPATFTSAVEVELDGVSFRLVKVRYSSTTSEIELTFEDRIVYWLRRKRGARRPDRERCTRAEFILSLLREVQTRNYRFVCPDLHVKQPVDRKPRTRAAATKAPAKGAADDGAEGGFAAGAELTVKGKAASPAQRRRMAGILNEARRLGASELVMAACLACATQESVMGEKAGKTGNDDVGLYQQGRNWIDAKDAMDPAKTTRAFLTGAINGGGARGWKQVHGSLTVAPGGFSTAITKVQVSVGGYSAWETESRRAVRAFQGDGRAADDDSSHWTLRRRQLARNSDEDSWTAIQRLASEVNWRCFVVGNSVYYMSEPDLYARRPRYEVRPSNPAVLEFSYDVDWGKPTSEATLTVALERWGAPPGAVVVVAGYGPPDGRWLVSQVSRDWFAPTAEITLIQPGKALGEPVERVQRANSASGSFGASTASGRAARVYDAARAIHARGYPYVWGGGHSRCGTPDGGTGRDPGTGYDCSGSVCAALGAAGLGYRTGGKVDASPAIARDWGQPGRGRQFTVWANATHVWIEFHGLGSAKRFDTSPVGDKGGRGPRMRGTERPTAGFTARHWEGC
jgi:hypothetical protein